MLDVLLAFDLAQSRLREQFDSEVGAGGRERRSSRVRPRFALRRRNAARAWPADTARSSVTAKPAPGRS
jgi:hypothetical protein